MQCFICDHLLEQWLTGEKREEERDTKLEYFDNEESFLDEIKSIFRNFLTAIEWWEKNNRSKI